MKFNLCRLGNLDKQNSILAYVIFLKLFVALSLLLFETGFTTYITRVS